MPYGDGTGPDGRGPRGRRMGPCSWNGARGYNGNYGPYAQGGFVGRFINFFGRRGYGQGYRGYGMGRGRGWGRGWGRGQGRW